MGVMLPTLDKHEKRDNKQLCMCVCVRLRLRLRLRLRAHARVLSVKAFYDK
jgi:hypothetical protein